MKTIKDDLKRRLLFDNILDNFDNGNLIEYKIQLNRLSRIDLIRFVNFLSYFGYKYQIQVSGEKKLILSEI